jgi:uroporphyrinogen decarboxylase
MRNSADLVRKVLAHGEPESVPRGELWINSGVLASMEFKDTLEGHLRLRNRLGMDAFFLPVSDIETFNSSQGYRYFSIQDVREALELSNLFVAVIIDGPFQKLVDRYGLLAALGMWRKDKRAFMQKYRREAERIKKLVNQCVEAGIKLVVIADDLAYEGSTYLNPADAEEFVAPFYHEIADGVHRADGYTLFHSCGNIRGLLPQIASSGINGLAACQIRFMDLLALKKEYRSSMVVFAGIEPDHLSPGTLTETLQRDFQNSVWELANGGGFFLCSSSGIYKPEFIDRIISLYELVEKRFNSG